MIVAYMKYITKEGWRIKMFHNRIIQEQLLAKSWDQWATAVDL